MHDLSVSKVEPKSPGDVTNLNIFPNKLDEVSDLFPSSHSPSKIEKDKAKIALQQLMQN